MYLCMYDMLCYVMLCYVMLCYVMLCVCYIYTYTYTYSIVCNAHAPLCAPTDVNLAWRKAKRVLGKVVL